jgi:hypothetical protein
LAAHAAGRGGLVSEQQPAVLDLGAAELLFELAGEPVGGEIGGEHCHTAEHRTPGLARRGAFAKLAA